MGGAGAVAAFGAVAGLVWLARLDFGIPLAVFLGLLLVARPRRVGRLVAAGALAALPVALALLRVHAVAGRWMPTSGSAEAGLVAPGEAGFRLLYMLKALVEQATPWAYTLEHDLPSLAAAASLVALLAWLGRALRPPPGRPEVRLLGAWAVALAPLVLAYVLFFGTTYFYGRYAAPVAVVALPLLGAAVARRLGASPPWAARLALPAAFAFWCVLTLHVAGAGNPHAAAAGFAGREPYRSARIGAFQSGVIGYFNPNVYNLDGKLDRAALDDLAAHRIDRYVDRRHIEVLLVWPAEVERELAPGYLAAGWTACRDRVPDGRTLCYARRGTPAAAAPRR